MDFLPHFGLRYVLGDIEAEVDLEDRAPLSFNARISPWDIQDRKFVKLFRLSKPLARGLCQELEPRLPVASRTSAIPYDIRVLTAVSFMANGSYQECVGITDTLACSNQVFWEKYGFPGTVGAVDGTHVAIVSPPKLDQIHPENIYVNRKNFHSINTQIISDSDRRILSIWARFPGSTHDFFIWSNSRVKQELNALYERGTRNTWLIGDSGYGLEPVLMKPFDNTVDGSPEERFNNSLRKARATVECTIGLLKNIFRCLLKERTLHYYPPVAANIIHACAALHNMCLDNNVPLLLHNEQIVNDEIVPVDNVNNHYGRALFIRNTIVRNYFTN